MGTGIINVNPGFVDPASGKYQLGSTSPCIDVGDPAAIWNDVNFPPSRGTARNDLGAYGGQVSAQPYQEATAYINYTYDLSGNQTKRQLILAGNLPQSLLKSASRGDNIDYFEYATAEFNDPVAVQTEELLGKLKITVYPNPTQGLLQVEIAGREIPLQSMIVLYNSASTVIRQIKPISASNYLDITAYPPGIYFMRLIVGEEVSVWKIIKE